MDKNLIAPCGMNCGLCLSYLRDKNKCPSCFSGRKVNGKCINCAIKLCKKRTGDYCFNCDEYPCDRLKRLDKRYREKYEMSMIDNLETIKNKGIEFLIKQEQKKWLNSDGTYCVHDKKRYPKMS